MAVSRCEAVEGAEGVEVEEVGEGERAWKRIVSMRWMRWVVCWEMRDWRVEVEKEESMMWAVTSVFWNFGKV